MAGEALLTRISSIKGIRGAAFADPQGVIKGTTIHDQKIHVLISYLATLVPRFEQQAGFGCIQSVTINSPEYGLLTYLAGRQTALIILAEDEHSGQAVSASFRRYLR